MPELSRALAVLEEAFSRALEAPLSTRRAMLVALLIDDYLDRVFAADSTRGDILEFRERLGATSPSLRMVLDLCAMDPGGPRLATATVSIPLEAYGTLAIEDFMVSLYNGHTVQRVVLQMPDGGHVIAHTLFSQAIRDLAALPRPES